MRAFARKKKRREQGDLSASSVPSDHTLERIHRCTDTHFDPFSFVVVGVVDGLESQEQGHSYEDLIKMSFEIDRMTWGPHTETRTRTTQRRDRVSGGRSC